MYNVINSLTFFIISEDGEKHVILPDFGHTHGKIIYHCPGCFKQYLNRISLNRHLKYECGVDPKFECNICSRRFRHNFTLQTHMAVHRMEPPTTIS